MSRLHITNATAGARALVLLSLALPALLVPGCGAGSGESSDEEREHVLAAEQGLNTGYTPIATSPAGTIPGTFAVDEKGGATYVMPLTVPPGAGGVEPKLSLIYSSRQGNGMLGMRVSLGGLSAITRCPMTKAQDGYHGRVAGDQLDRFCLDGQRLIQISGDYYGADGAEYRTEIDNGSRVVSKGACDSGPCRFEITDKHGNRAYYGYDPEGFGALGAYEDLPNGTVDNFALNRLENPNGAYYTVRYLRDAGQIYPAEIVYTQHASVPLLARRVTFVYEDRPDVQPRYLNGARSDTRKRLKTIQTSIDVPQGGQRVAREYRLAYTTSQASRRSLLDTVRECDASGVCLPPTQLQWKSDAAETFYVVQPTSDPRYQTELNADHGCRLITGDFNGDGKTDFIRQEINGWAHDQSNNFNVYLSRGDGTFDIVVPLDVNRYRHYRQDQNGAYQPGVPEGTEFQTWLSGHWGANIITGDFNGDGKTDFIRQEKGDWANDQSNNFNVYLSKGDGYFDVYTPTVPKGYQRLWVKPNNTFVQEQVWGDEFQTWMSANYGSKIIPGDFNGDGKTDFLRQEINGWGVDEANNLNVYLSQGNGHFDVYRPEGADHQKMLSGTHGAHIIPGDFDGDGKTDFIRQEFGDWDNDDEKTFGVYFSLGNGRFNPVFPNGMEYQRDMRFDPGAYIIPGDFNGDGKTDFIRQEHGDWDNDDEKTFGVYFSRGDGYFDVVWPQGREYQIAMSEASGARIVPIDWNGDGKTDFIRQDHGQHEASDNFQVWVSRGDGTFDIVTPPGVRFQTDLRFEPGALIIPGDFDGDGKADFLRQEHGDWADDFNNMFDVYFGKGLSEKGPSANMSIPAPIAPVDQAVTIVNGLGGKTTIRYKPLKDVLHDAAKMRGDLGGMFVVESYAQDDGRSAPVERGMLYSVPVIDPDERGFVGFAWTRERIMSTGVETYWNFHTSFPLSGMLLDTTKVGDGVVKRDWQTYTVTQPYPGVQRVRTDGEVNDVQRNGQVQRIWRRHTYDAWGNRRLTHIEPAEPDATQNYDECIEYAVDTNQWRTDYPTAKYVAASCSLSGDACSCANPIEGTRWEYDDKMNATTTSRMQAGSTFLRTTFTYDELGNVLTKTDPTLVTTTFGYDPYYRTYPETETRSGGSLSEGWVYDYEPRFGKRIYTRDPSAHQRWVLLDGLGRERGIHELDPSNAAKLVSLEWLDPALRARHKLLYDDWTETRFRETIEYLDGFERVYKEETVRATDVVVVDRVFDEEGRVKKESTPHLASEAPIWKAFKFDALGRTVESVTGPDGCVPGNGCSKSTATITHDKLVASNGWYTTHITLTEGVGTSVQRTSEEWRDSRDRVIKREDPDHRVTTFAYDVRGRKVSASDGASPVTITYDGLGNIVQTSSPDRGAVTHTYSSTTGLLAESNESGGQKIAYAYDALGRLATKSVVGKATTTYRYDTPRAGFTNGKGRLTEVEIVRANETQPASKYAFSYDKSGRVIAESVTIEGETYTITRTYDPTGRPLTVGFPDGTTLASTYTKEGALQSLLLGGVEYARWSGHNGERQPATLTYKNGTTTAHSYDAFRRLATSKVTGPNATTLLDYTYAWDAAHHITGITDNRDATRSQSFTYWPGGSLKQATGIYGQIKYEYDAWSNLERKIETLNGVETTVDYGHSAHRVTSATGQAFAYGANGDRVSSTKAGVTTTYAYDGEHRLTTVEEGGVTLNRFAYDFEGERVLKVDRDGTKTLYITKEYEVMIKPDNTHLATKYLHGPAGRVAAITSVIPAPTAMLDTAPPQDGVRTAFGVVTAARGRLGIAATGMLAATALALAFCLGRLRMTRAGIGRAAARLRSLLLPPATAWAKKHPVHAAVVPVVMMTFLSACVPGSYERTSYSEDPLTAGANGAGNPIVGEFFFHHNHLGSSSVVTNASGVEVARAEYKPYGELVNNNTASPGQDIFRAKFTGKEWDNDSSLYYYGARYYDPATGRFLTADKYLHGGQEAKASSLNPYAYADDNPVMYTDPSGHFPLAIIAIVVVGAAVGGFMGAQSANGTWDVTKWTTERTLIGAFVGAAVGALTAWMGAQPGLAWSMGSALLSSSTTEGLKFLSPEGNSVQGFFTGVAEGLALQGASSLKSGAKGFTKEGLKAGLKYAGEKAIKKLAGRAASDAFDMVRDAASEDAHPKPAEEARAHWERVIAWSQDRASNAMLVVK